MRKILILLIILVINCYLSSCNKDKEPIDDKNILKQTEGYVVGFDNCSAVTINEEIGSAEGYYIISSDLKDTLLTYNLPSEIYAFPTECFNHLGRAFPDKYRTQFKIQFSYSIVSENEKTYPLCAGNKLISEYNNAIQINIKSTP